MDKETKQDIDFKEQAIQALIDLGLPEDEAEQQVDDYIDTYNLDVSILTPQ